MYIYSTYVASRNFKERIVSATLLLLYSARESRLYVGMRFHFHIEPTDAYREHEGIPEMQEHSWNVEKKKKKRKPLSQAMAFDISRIKKRQLIHDFEFEARVFFRCV